MKAWISGSRGMQTLFMSTLFMSMLFMSMLFILGSSLGSMARADADCTVHTGPLSWLYEGYTINYEQAVVDALGSKGYRIVENEPDADFTLRFTLSPVNRQYFQFATARTDWISNRGGPERLTASREKRCLTQLCGISDFVSPIRGVISELKANLPACR